MTFETVLSRLEALGVPMAHVEFKETKKAPIPSPPYLLWSRADYSRGPDGMNLLTEVHAYIELYTDSFGEAMREQEEEKRAELESLIEADVLYDLDYDKFKEPIHEENVYQTSYEFKILQKRRKRHDG